MEKSVRYSCQIFSRFSQEQERSKHVSVIDRERLRLQRDKHCQQLIVNSRHDLKRGVEVDFFGDLQHVKLLCRNEQQCCSVFPSIGKFEAVVGGPAGPAMA